jgi:hypothetical protein
MWRIEEHRRVDKQLSAAPREILKRYEKWKDIAMLSGPPGLRLIGGFDDEALSGKWKGYRSSGCSTGFFTARRRANSFSRWSRSPHTTIGGRK